MNTAEFFAVRRARADFAAFDKIMRRKHAAEPGAEDRLPEAGPQRKAASAKKRAPRRRD